jgi:hypothetical protein
MEYEIDEERALLDDDSNNPSLSASPARPSLRQEPDGAIQKAERIPEETARA